MQTLINHEHYYDNPSILASIPAFKDVSPFSPLPNITAPIQNSQDDNAALSPLTVSNPCVKNAETLLTQSFVVHRDSVSSKQFQEFSKQ